MATIKAVLAEFVRNELDDELNTRWSDARLLAFYKQAVTRMMSLGQKHRLAFVRKKDNFTLPAETSTYTLPADYLAPVEPDSMIRLDQNKSVTFKTGSEFDRIISTSPLSCYTIYEGVVTFKTAELADVDMVFRYYIDVKPMELLISSQTPWNGQLDMPLVDYVKLRALNVDRFDTSPDMGLLQDMEKRVLDMYSYQEPVKYRSKGWVPSYGIWRGA